MCVIFLCWGGVGGMLICTGMWWIKLLTHVIDLKCRDEVTNERALTFLHAENLIQLHSQTLKNVVFLWVEAMILICTYTRYRNKKVIKQSKHDLYFIFKQTIQIQYMIIILWKPLKKVYYIRTCTTCNVLKILIFLFLFSNLVIFSYYNKRFETINITC